jgi:hypothetical protein
MLLSRFWYVVLSLVLGALVFVLYLAQSMYNRSGARDIAEGLQADAQVVSWYLKNDARERSAHLIKFAVNDAIGKNLAKSSSTEERIPEKVRDEVRQGLLKVNETIPKETAFDAVFAVDQHGRVVAHLGYEQASGMEDFELGGYPVIADALHGFIRDDTLVLDRVYRVVARPIEYDLGQMPSGAIVGARIIDDRFARELSTRTGAAIAFYSGGQRVASGAPADFEKSQLDMIINDLEEAEKDSDYQELGRSSVRHLGKTASVVYTRLLGEAWDLRAGYVVGRMSREVESPLGFFKKADDKDKATANIPLVVGIVLLAMLLGMLFSYIEYNRPLLAFRKEAQRFAKAETDHLAPSKFGGLYRTIASDINDGIDVVVGKAGGTRRAADLSQVLGDLPAEPKMSAFAVPGAEPPPAEPDASPFPEPAAASAPSNPKPKALPKPPGRLPSAPSNPLVDNLKKTSSDAIVAPPLEGGTIEGQPPPPPVPAPGPPSANGNGAGEDPEWEGVFQQFVKLKDECGEPTEGFTFEKFKKTLEKNRDAIIQRHGVSRVKFSVYVKDGKAALKASPQRD